MRLTTLLLCMCVALVVGAFLFPVYAGDLNKESARRYACLSNLKQLGLGLLMYAGDENDRFPPRDAWADAIVPYTKNRYLFLDPALRKDGKDGPPAYAFNGALSRAKPPKEPERVPLAYDSVAGVRNASDLVKSLPVPGRHDGKDNVVYADGHAKAIAVGRP